MGISIFWVLGMQAAWHRLHHCYQARWGQSQTHTIYWKKNVKLRISRKRSKFKKYFRSGFCGTYCFWSDRELDCGVRKNHKDHVFNLDLQYIINAIFSNTLILLHCYFCTELYALHIISLRIWLSGDLRGVLPILGITFVRLHTYIHTLIYRVQSQAFLNLWTLHLSYLTFDSL